MDFPDADELAMLRASYAGMPFAKPQSTMCRIESGQRSRHAACSASFGGGWLSSRGRSAGRISLLFLNTPTCKRFRGAKAVTDAIEVLRHAGPPSPQISDDIGLWQTARAVPVPRAHDIATLTDLTVQIPRRRHWWKAVAGLGPASARRIEAFFTAHPALSERARAPIAVRCPGAVVPWESLGWFCRVNDDATISPLR
ncbi:phage integrase family protein [Paraburkholderia phytofirmans]